MNYEKDIESRIREVIINNSYIEADIDDEVMFPDVEDVQTFEEASLCTTDNGIIVDLKDGVRIYLTIHAYKWKEND